VKEVNMSSFSSPEEAADVLLGKLTKLDASLQKLEKQFGVTSGCAPKKNAAGTHAAGLKSSGPSNTVNITGYEIIINEDIRIKVTKVNGICVYVCRCLAFKTLLLAQMQQILRYPF
jgi:hypothetical protein